MRRNRRIALTASFLGLALLGGDCPAQTQPPLAPLPEAPGSNYASPANIAYDIREALASQPSTGPAGGVPINLSAALRLAGEIALRAGRTAAECVRAEPADTGIYRNSA